MHMTGPSTKGPLFLAQGAAGAAGAAGRLKVPFTVAGWHNLFTIGAFFAGCFFAGLATAKRDGDTPINVMGTFTLPAPLRPVPLSPCHSPPFRPPFPRAPPPPYPWPLRITLLPPNATP